MDFNWLYWISNAFQRMLTDFRWIQIGFNPDRGGQFYNKITGEPIFKAEEVIQVGEHVLAKNIQKATKTELRKLRVGKENPRMFKKGGSIVERNPNSYNMRAI